jgi:hypothetical protein
MELLGLTSAFHLLGRGLDDTSINITEPQNLMLTEKQFNSLYAEEHTS